MARIKKVWKKLTSPKAKKKYKKATEATVKSLTKANVFFRNMGEGVDEAIGVEKRKKDYNLPNPKKKCPYKLI